MHSMASGPPEMNGSMAHKSPSLNDLTAAGGDEGDSDSDAEGS